LNLSVDLCIERAQARRNHPTLGEDRAEEVIREFAQRLQVPEKWEGPYTKMRIANNPDEVKVHVKELLEYNVRKK
jgi:hypothetical protein